MLNRTSSPAFKQVNEINFIAPAKQELDNGIPVYSFNAQDVELLRIEFIFNHVNWDARMPLQAVAVNSLINNGTQTRSAKEIADQVDYYGAFLQTEYGADQLVVTLYTLHKHLASVLPIVKDMLTDSVFPQQELDIYTQNQKQKLQVNLKKNDFLARKAFANELFGDSPYGSDITSADYEALRRDDLIAYFQAAFQVQNCTIIIAGKVDQNALQLIESSFGSSWSNHSLARINEFTFSKPHPNKIRIARPEAVQNAIRMGKMAINRTHQDFAGFQVLNTVLGGYFGSRLMANIREDKGYTYGIGSGIASLKHAGYFFIATEVGADVCDAALLEIYKEIQLLRTETISEEELALVRNYMLGSLLGSLENIFSHADKFKNLLFAGLDYSYYTNYIQTVKNISVDEIKMLAERYLNPADFVEVVVGRLETE